MQAEGFDEQAARADGDRWRRSRRAAIVAAMAMPIPRLNLAGARRSLDRLDRLTRSDRLGERSLAIASIIGFWGFYTVIVSLRAAVLEFPAQGELLARRLVVTLIGIMLTWALYLLLAKAARRPLAARVGIAFAGALPVALLSAMANYWLFNIYDPMSLIEDARAASAAVTPWQEIAEITIARYFFVASWASFFLAASYARDVRRVERAAGQYARAAQAAELRALRYQINPHFLFNTLNSLSSLVLARRTEEAEAMIMNLATFYRSTLSDDPLAEISLGEEVAMQQRYLAIEAVRYGARLRAVIDVPDDLAAARVPGLILQPLIENAIRHGVARTSRPVTIIICAAVGDGGLHLSVIDDAGCSRVVAVPGEAADGGGAGAEPGGIGLANVRERLETRYGNAARFVAARQPDGGFAVHLFIPIADMVA